MLARTHLASSEVKELAAGEFGDSGRTKRRKAAEDEVNFRHCGDIIKAQEVVRLEAAPEVVQVLSLQQGNEISTEAVRGFLDGGRGGPAGVPIGE